MRIIEKSLTVALFPFATTFRVIGVVVWETLELLEELASKD